MLVRSRVLASRTLRSRGVSDVARLTPEQLERKYLVGTYNSDGVRGAEGLVFVRGERASLFDDRGRKYVDWAAGIAVNALGHSDGEWAAAVGAQAATLTHLSNLFHSYEPLHLAAELVQSAPAFDKVFLCNSGTEANEAALKFARKFALANAQRAAAGVARNEGPPPPAHAAFGCKAAKPSACFTRGGVCGCWLQSASNDVAAHVRDEVVAFKGSFHGRSMGALAATHKPAIRAPFAPFGGDVKFARFNRLDDAAKYVSKRTAAIIVEPVQGEGGVVPADAAFMRGLRALADESGALLIVDEVQCGLGRTGRLWAHEAYGVKPDMMSIAKPLAGGLPVGALLVTDAVASAILPGEHGTTFGGNPLVARAALTVLRRIAQPAFLEATRARGARLIGGFKRLAARFPRVITEVRAPLDGGLFVGVELAAAPKPLVRAALDAGLIVITGGESALRVCPPLIIDDADIDFGLRVLEDAIPKVYPTLV